VKSLSELQSDLKPTRTITEVIPMNERKRGKNAETTRDKTIKVKDSIYASKHPMLLEFERPYVKLVYERAWIKCKQAMDELKARLEAFHNNTLPLIDFDPEIPDLIKKIKYYQHMKQKVRDAATKQFGARNKLFQQTNKTLRIGMFRGLKQVLDFVTPRGEFDETRIQRLNMEPSQLKNCENLLNKFLSLKLGFLNVEVVLDDGKTYKSESPKQVWELFSNRHDDIEPVFAARQTELDKHILSMNLASQGLAKLISDMNIPAERRPVVNAPPPVIQ
jgi:hypothetical protein